MARCAPEGSRVLLRLPYVVGAVLATVSATGVAAAQEQRLGVPLVPVLPVSRPIIAEPGLSVTASGDVAYDDNIFRTNSDRTPSVDDVIVTTGARTVYLTQIGSNDLRLDADLAYSFFTQNSDRSRGRADVRGDATFRIAGACQITPSARLLKQQADYGDINAARDNFQTLSDLSLRASCPRTVGLYPVVDLDRRTTVNSTAFDFADLKTVSILGGIGYNRPSLGQAVLYYRYLDNERPAINVTNRIDQIGVTFNRAVVSAVTLSADVHYLNVQSRGASVRPYQGAGWDASIEVRPVPALELALRTGRRIVNDSLVPAGYAIQTDYTLGAELTLAERTRLRASALLGGRRFRGDALVIAVPFATDDFQSYTLGATRQIGARLRANIDAQYSNRTTDTQFNEYRFTRLVAGVSYRF
jgi:hypothetical protein